MAFIGITARVWEWVRRLMRPTAGPHAAEGYPDDAQDTSAPVEPGNGAPELVEAEPNESQDESLADDPESVGIAESSESQDAPLPDVPPADGPGPLETEPAESQDPLPPDEPPTDGPETDGSEPAEFQDALPPDEPPADGPEPEETEPDEAQDAPAPDESPAGGPEPKDTEPDDVQDAPAPDESPADDPEPEETEPDEAQDVPAPDESPAAGPEPEETEPDEAQDASAADEPPTDGPESVEAELYGAQDTPAPDEPESREEAGRRERAPRDIGGRRSRPRVPSAGSSRRGAGAFRPKPELICRERRGSQDWELILSVPEERDVEDVLHNGTPLLGEEGEYRPSSFSGVLVVKYADGDSEETRLIDDAPFIFKLRNEWESDGRKTRSMTKGHFIVIAPREWTRTGRVRVEASGCADGSYVAHYFFSGQEDDTSSIGGFEECDLSVAGPGYVLNGMRIHDDSESGDLFVGDAPTLEPAAGIVWVRVGEEAQDGWKGMSFKPAEKTLSDVLGGRSGRFFVRVYDSVTLVDSEEFRYSAELREIRVNGEPYLTDMLLAPVPEGHSTVPLSFVGVDGSAVSVELTTANGRVTTASDGLVTVAPHPEADETTWSLGPDGPDVVIRLPRVWWRLVRPGADADDWRDHPIPMSREEYRELVGADMEVRLPAHVRRVRAGFDFGKRVDQSYDTERDGKLRRVNLPLAAFVDYEEIDTPSKEDVSLKIRCAGDDIELIHVIPDAPPPRPESLRDQERRRDRRRDGIRRDDTGRPGRRGPKSRRNQARQRIPEKIPIVQQPHGVPKQPLVVKNPLRRYHLNLPNRDAALFTLVARAKCPEHQLPDNERSTSHTSVGKHIREVRECCASTADYLVSGRLLKDAVFRVVLSEYDRPLTAQQISDELSKRWPTSKRDLSPRIIERLLDSDPNYHVSRSHEPQSADAARS